MFREQLHTAFDNISPSPELLDRVSAMMSEEVNKKKAPLRLNVVKYGGIAAALALAAGGTFLVLNNQNGGIKTSDTAKAAVKADNAIVSEFSGASAGAAAQTTFATTTTREAYAEEINIAGVEADEPDSADNADMGISANGIIADAAGGDEDDNYKMSEEAVTKQNAAAEEKYMEDNEYDDMAPESFMIDATPAEDVPEIAKAAETECAEEELTPAYTSQASIQPAGDDTDMRSGVVPDGMTVDAPTAEEDAVTESAADPATGMLCTDPFLDLRTWSLTIPDQLEDLVEGVRTVGADDETIYGEKWREYVHAVMSANKPTTIEDELNIYTFMKYFNIPVEDARKALYNAADTKTGVPGITLTREEADIILTMDIEKITAAFANPYAIVKGTAIYAPKWLLEHSFDDYRAAGITKDDIREKYGLISTMADNFSDAIIGKDSQTALNKKLDEYLK